jgi:hypothetical protein
MPRWPFLAALAVAAALAWAGCGDSSTDRNVTPLPSLASGGSAMIAISSATVPPDTEFTVEVTVTPEEGGSVGALDLSVSYDGALLTMVECSATGGAVCNAAPGETAVLFRFAGLDGVSGSLGSITFKSQSAEGQTPLRATVEACANIEANLIDCAGVDGLVTISAAAGQ